jgi:hypothetical protein
MNWFFKKRETKIVSMTQDEACYINDKIGADALRYFGISIPILADELSKLLKNKKELPLYIGIHPKIDQAIGFVLRGYGVIFREEFDRN